MTLLDIYTGWSGLEVFFFVVALALIIVPIFIIFDWIKPLKTKVIMYAICVVTGAVLIMINSFVIPNYTYYTYYVTDMTQLQTMVNDGYIVTDNSSNNIYDLRKGE